MRIGLGLDVGGTKILACAITSSGELVAETKVDSPRTPELLLEALTEAAEAIVDLVGSRRHEIAGVGVGVPSLVTSDGTLYSSPNLPALEGLPVREAFASRLHDMAEESGASTGSWNLVLDNDATCAAAGEWAFGAARGFDEAVILTLGTGIGGGVITAGRILRGRYGFAGEVGHMVIDPSGPTCTCGRSGCLEQFASGSALGRLGREWAEAGRAPRLVELAAGSISTIRGEQVLTAAREGDASALAIFAELSSSLATGISNIAEILDPSVVILGGGLADAGDILLSAVRTAFARDGRRGSGPQAIPVILAELGPRAGAFGAAAEGIGLVS